MSDRRMKVLDPGELSPRQAYDLLISLIVPRPIALVSTVSSDGVRNLAPFSFFNAVSSRPPVVSLSIARGREREKDTLRNLRDTKEFVVNVVDGELLEAAVQAGAGYPPDRDEFEATGLTPVPSDKVAPARVGESPAQMECVAVELIDEPAGAPVTLVLGRVMRFHVGRHAWISETKSLDPEMLDPAARLGGALYAKLGAIREIPIPAVDE